MPAKYYLVVRITRNDEESVRGATVGTNFKENCTMAYSAKLMDHYENPRNVGSLNKEDTHVGTGMVGAPACG